MKTTNNNYTEDEFLEKIKYLINNGQDDKAADYILEASELYPRNGEFLFLKGNILHNSGDYEEAIKCFEKAEKCGFNPVSVLRCKAYCYLNCDEYEEAIDCYDRAIKIDPDDAETWYSKGRTLGIMNEFEEAYNCFNKAVELSPKNPNYLEFKRLASEELRKINIPEGLESSLTSEEECLEQGNGFMDEGLYKNAHLCFKKAVEYNPDNDEAWGCLGIALIRLGNYDKALKTFEKTISLKENSVWWFYKGVTFDKLKKAEKAIKCLYKAVEIDPGNKDYWFFLGGLLAEERKYEEAISCYKNVTSLNPESAEAWREIGDITLHGLQKYEEAISYYDKVIELNPKDDDTVLMKGLALSYTANKKEEEAIKWYDNALKINPDNQQAMENKATSFRRLGRLKEAKACYKNAAKINPDTGDSFYHGSMAFGEKKYEEAIEYYNEELKRYPLDRSILSMKGWTLVKLGRYEEAMQCFLKCEYNVLNIFTRLVAGDDIQEGVEEKRGIMPYIADALKNDVFFMSIKEQIKENLDLYKEIYIQEMEIISFLNVYPSYEELIAHYTKETVAKYMLVDKSPLWLSMVTKSNDPREGQSLLDYFYGKNVSGKGGYIDEQFGVFSASFTFNIDHLNHFRLYGKSADGIEAGGVSIVVNQLLFKDPHYEKGSQSSVSSVVEELKTEKEFELDKDLRLPLFRCIYIDPDTGFVASLGQREEYTFHQLNEDGKNEVDNIDPYKNRINETLHEVRRQLAELKTKIEKLDPEIVSQLMLPLRYLIKNVSFKEEQECRIFVVKSLTDKNMKTCKINNIEKKYFDYFEINERVNKVILGTNCKLRNDEIFLKDCKINKKEDIISSIWQFT